MAIKFMPSWVNEISGGICSVEVVKNVAESQAHFFNWLYKCDVEITSKRLPTTDPLTIFKALMQVDLPPDLGSFVKDLILNLVENPDENVDLAFLWGQEINPTQHFNWLYNDENGVTSFSMGQCERHDKSFCASEVKLAKLLFMTELFLHLRNTARITNGSSVTAQHFQSQPILTALYAAHVTAYNL